MRNQGIFVGTNHQKCDISSKAQSNQWRDLRKHSYTENSGRANHPGDHPLQTCLRRKEHPGKTTLQNPCCHLQALEFFGTPKNDETGAMEQKLTALKAKREKVTYTPKNWHWNTITPISTFLKEGVVLLAFPQMKGSPSIQVIPEICRLKVGKKWEQLRQG